MYVEIPSNLHDTNSQVYESHDIVLAKYCNEQTTELLEVKLTKNLFLFVREGQKQITVHHESATINSDTGALILSDTYLMSEFISRQTSRFTSLMILVDDVTLLNIWQQAKELIKPLGQTSTCTQTSRWILFYQTSLIHSSIQTLELYLANHREIPCNLLITKLQELLLYMAGSDNAPHLDQLIGQIRKTNSKLKDFMEANFNKRWNIEQFAQNYGFSLSTFKRIFKETYNESPKSWINNRRLEQAALALMTRPVNLSELALDLGFSDSSQFSKAFRNKYHCTPSQYRHQGRMAGHLAAISTKDVRIHR